MKTTERIEVRIAPELKKALDAFAARLGLSTNALANLALYQIAGMEPRADLRLLLLDETRERLTKGAPKR